MAKEGSSASSSPVGESTAHLVLGLFVLGLLLTAGVSLLAGIWFVLRHASDPVGAGLCFLASAVALGAGMQALVRLQKT